MTTHGRFSHAMICVEPPVFIEAVAEGVSLLNLHNCFIHNIENVNIFRYNDEKIANIAADKASFFLGQKYSVRSAIMSALPSAVSPRHVSNGTFCSALVAAAFKIAGAPEFTHIEPLRTTPNQLGRIANFSIIPCELVTKSLVLDRNRLVSALDGERNRGPLYDQAKILNSYFESVSSYLAKIYENYPVEGDMPQSISQLLEWLCKYSFSLAKNRWRYSTGFERSLVEIDELLAQEIDKGAYDAMLDEVAQFEIMRNVRRLKQVETDINRDRLRDELDQMQRLVSIREKTVNDPSTPLGYSKAWDRWQKIEHKIIELQKYNINELNKRILS